MGVWPPAGPIKSLGNNSEEGSEERKKGGQEERGVKSERLA